MEARGIGFGKLLLFGEHSAVYGYPAIGIPLPVRTEISIMPGTLSEWQFTNLPEEYLPHVSELFQRAEEFFPELCNLKGEVLISSDVTVSQGLGSSAAVCVAVTRAASSLLKRELEEREIWKIANQLEKQFHGTPSGIDTGLALGGHISALLFEEDPLPVKKDLLPPALHLVFGSIPREKQTSELVAELRKSLVANPDLNEKISRLGNLTEKAINLIDKSAEGLADKLALLANEAQAELRSLGLSTEKLDTIIELGLRNGALGGKLSGAGGGGAFYLIFKTSEEAQAGVEKLQTDLGISVNQLELQPPLDLH